MSGKIALIGTGPGGTDYITPAAWEEVEKADILIGGDRALEPFKKLNKNVYRITGKLAKVLDFIKENRNYRICILLSGDTGFYSLLPYLKRNLPDANFKTIPGISSIQVAFARINETWHDSLFISLHGRDLSNLAKVENWQGKIALLTCPESPPAKIASLILKNRTVENKVYLFYNLTTPEEAIIAERLGSLPKSDYKGGGVMVILDE